VMGLHGEEAELAISGKRMRVPTRELVTIGGPASSGGAARRSSASAGVAEKQSSGASAEINLVGLTVDEAIPKLDKALDNAAIAERSQLRVIHGFGQGILRRAVAEFLEGHPHVAKVNVASEGRGGVTVVELRE